MQTPTNTAECTTKNAAGQCVCPYACTLFKQKCGSGATVCGGKTNKPNDHYSVVKHNGECTPFAVLPRVTGCANPGMQAISESKDGFTAVMKEKDASDFWVFHDCDGAC